jgi:hypothetical protein
MKRKKILMVCVLIAFVNNLSAQNKVTLSSQNGQITFRFGLEAGHPEYSVKYKNTSLIERSTIGLTFINNDFFGSDMEVGKITTVDGMED